MWRRLARRNSISRIDSACWFSMARFVGQFGCCFDRLAVERCCCKHVSRQPASGTDLDGLVLRHDRLGKLLCSCDDRDGVRSRGRPHPRQYVGVARVPFVHTDVTRDPSSAFVRLQRSGEFSAFVIHQGGSAKPQEKYRLDMDRLPRGHGILDTKRPAALNHRL